MERNVKDSVIASFGSFVQWFDNTLFSVMLPLIIFNFVPQDINLNESFTFLITYSSTLFTRPFGAFIFAHYADYFGRKKVLVMTCIFMGMSTLFLAVCPSVKTIGVAAPAFLLLFMFLHGFSSGGEWPTSSTYIYEINTKASMAKAGTISSFNMILGILAANLLIQGFLAIKSFVFIGEWSWRLLFIFSSMIAFITAFLRSRIKESSHVLRTEKRFKLISIILKYKKQMLYAFMLSSIDGLIFNLFFNNLYPFTNLNINRAYEFLATVLALSGSWFLYRVSKNLGANRTLKIGLLLLILTATIQLFLPDSIAMGYYRLFYILPTFLYMIPIVGKLPSLFNQENRAFCVGFSRNTALFLFGGIGLVSMRWLFKPAGIYIALYVLILSLLSFLTLQMLAKKNHDIY